MLSANVIQSLKRSNTSVDTVLTKERLSKLWKSATREMKNEVLALSGLKISAIYRSNSQGALSPTVALSVAQVMNVSPQFLTGEIDQEGECSADNIKDFFKTNGLKNRVPRGNTQTIEFAEEEEEDIQTDFVPDPSPEVEANAPVLEEKIQDNFFLPDLSDSEWEILFKSMLLKARTSGIVRQRLDKIKSLLLL